MPRGMCTWFSVRRGTANVKRPAIKLRRARQLRSRLRHRYSNARRTSRRRMRRSPITRRNRGTVQILPGEFPGQVGIDRSLSLLFLLLLFIFWFKSRGSPRLKNPRWKDRGQSVSANRWRGKLALSGITYTRDIRIFFQKILQPLLRTSLFLDLTGGVAPFSLLCGQRYAGRNETIFI